MPRRPWFDTWETNYDRIETTYKNAGHEVPQIVFWDLASANGTRTVEVAVDQKWVAMMNGFSPAMLKVFMGEEVQKEKESADDMEWEGVDADGGTVILLEEDEDGKDEAEDFTPISVMKKALTRASYDGLIVID